MNAIELSMLRDRVRGAVIDPGDRRYDTTRELFYRAYDKRPAVIVRPVDASDVAVVVTAASRIGAELAIRCGGHGVAGHGGTDGGIVIDLRDLNRLDVDLADRSAWAGSGLTAGQYTRAVGAEGLATGFGDTGSVGIGGITLAGGIGLLVRSHGLTIDSLLAAEVVTADGRTVHTDEHNHPDLFWALRGGGGNFGVVTRFRYRLHEVDDVVGGMLAFAADVDLILHLIEAAHTASDSVSMIINLIKAPPLPFLPEEYHGSPVIGCLFVHSGDPRAGEEFADQMRGLGSPIADMARRMRYPEFFEFGGGPTSIEREASYTTFLDEIDRGTVAGLFDQISISTAPLASAQLRVLGGQMARVPGDATAFAHRERMYMATAGVAYNDPAETTTHEEWIGKVRRILATDRPGAYSGFLGTDGAARIREAYPGKTWDRLVAVKQQYDPDNLFHLNHNVGFSR